MKSTAFNFDKLPQKIYQPMDINKEKQKEDIVQDEEVFLYKLYNISSKESQPKIPELIFIQEKINNLEKTLKILQSPVKTILFHSPPHYKTLQQNSEQNEQYWKEITIEFIKQKHNTNMSRRGFLIEMFIGGPPHKPFFITLLYEERSWLDQQRN